jgi:phosphate transport system substrate-binding protein
MLASKMHPLFQRAFLNFFLLSSTLPVYAETLFPHSGTLKVAGGTAHISFMQEIGNKLTQKNPGFRLLISGGGSGVGVQKLGAGLVDLANTGRPLSEEEKKRYDLSSYALAYDAITFVVNPQNPVANLSFSDLQKIFSGEVQTWETWTQEKQPIHLYVRDEASGTQDIFVEQVLKNKKLARAANYTNSQGAMKLAVAHDRYGIGFVSFGYLDDTVKGLYLNGSKATIKSIRTRTYPLVRELYVNAHNSQTPFIKAFINYLRGPESAQIISQWGLVPTYKPKNRQGVRKL